MSLLDAFLNESYRDLSEVWLAIRLDGQAGTGTLADPLNCKILFGPSLSVASITRGGSDLRDAVVNLPGHPFINGDEVEISGATGSDGAFYNGRFVIFGVASGTFNYRMKPPGPAGNASGTIRCAKVLAYPFDVVMASLPSYCTVHLGQGVFETRGYTVGGFAAWQPKAGQKLRGSGITTTVLKLSRADKADYPYHAIGSDYDNLLHTFEASDFTIDCNMGGQPILDGQLFARVTCGAVLVFGNHILLRRLQAINFGPQSVPECFVFFVNGEVNNVMEDCIVEQPSENNTHETSLFDNTGTDPVRANGRGGVIRQCYVNCEFTGVSSEPVAVASIVQTATPDIFTLTTKKLHHRNAGNNVLIGNLAPSTHLLNGSFLVTEQISNTELLFKVPNPPNPFPPYDASQACIGVDFHGPAVVSGSGCVTEANFVHDCLNPFYDDTGSTRDSVCRYNYYSNAQYGVNHNFGLTGGETPVRFADDAPAPAPVPLTHSGTLATFRAKTPHLLSVGYAVTIDGALVNGILDPTYNGTFSVESVSPTDNRVFSYRMKSVPNPDVDADRPTAQFPITFQARWQTRRLIIENNVLEVYPTDVNSWTVPRGVATYGYEDVPPYIFPQWIARDNVMRHRDNVPSTGNAFGQFAVGLRLDSTDGGIIESNLIDFEDPNPIQYLHSNNVKSFNNATASGVLIRGYNETAQRKDDELATLIEDAMLLSI